MVIALKIFMGVLMFAYSMWYAMELKTYLNEVEFNERTCHAYDYGTERKLFNIVVGMSICEIFSLALYTFILLQY